MAGLDQSIRTSSRSDYVEPSVNNVTEPELRAVFAAVFEIEANAVTDGSSPETVDKWDSFGHMRLVMTLEERFGVALDMDQVLEIDSFSALRAILIGDAG